MRRAATMALVVAFGMASFGGAGAREEIKQPRPTPPKPLKKVGDHWTAWDPPEPGPGDYIIVKGDTLWDLAGRWLGNPFLWPQIWDKNRYILDSHWIYPGDPLAIPGRPVVVPPEGPAEEEEEEEAEVSEAAPPAPPEAPAPPKPVLMPVAEPSDLYCSGAIVEGYSSSGLAIVGRDLERESLGQGDVVYLNRGRTEGVAAGSVWAVERPAREVRHPVSGEPLGVYVRRMGRVRVLVAQERTATAVIEEACEDIREGDALREWREMLVPMRAALPALARYEATPGSNGPRGYVVALRDGVQAQAPYLLGDMGVHAVGADHVIYTDLGDAEGARPGDVLTLYREQEGLPRTVLGQAIVLTVEGRTSTAKVTQAFREIGVGDRVELVR